ncbi:MAG: CCA tRNA nucleotidyltransferase [Rhodobacteraceae bacterium]|nr:CCA tRNA nucleotidyltransferase [Paracoccaceae bacterium]
MARVSGDWLEAPGTQAVLTLLARAGYQAYAVGGCVRNALLGVAVADVDIATDARPETVAELAAKAGFRAVPTGIEHGTITVVAHGEGHEVTTFRKDVETDGRRAVIAYADTMADDARRRDFTINALYADADGVLHDPIGGLADIRARRVRFIDDAHDRIREDYLRILRFFRFHAWYGDPAAGIDPDALAACAELADGLDTLSRERIGAEMRKLLAAPDPAPALAVMAQTGILARILPGAVAAGLAVLVHNEQALGLGPDWLRRLASLGGSDHRARLRMKKADARRLDLYRDKAGSGEPAEELAWRHGAKAAQDIILLRSSTLIADPPADLIARTEAAAAQVFPVRAADLAETGLQGPALGARLSALETRWIASGFRLDKAALLA